MKTLSVLLKSFCVSFLLLISTTFAPAQGTPKQTPWVAPPEADKLETPIADKEVALEIGQKIYTAECVVCHGTYGNAETNIAKNLEQKPKNFTKEDFMKQSDGAIFWKLSEGRGLMQPFKTMLSEEEIWSVVEYVRVLAAIEK